uniref:Uncharacterized protein n=1 Tax=Anguilla anguilla TaxID=7936 RepID=A0A0E9VVU7_ANGAN
MFHQTTCLTITSQPKPHVNRNERHSAQSPIVQSH